MVDERGSTLLLTIFYGVLGLALVLVVVSATSLYLERKRLFTLAESLGGVESLIAHPATMTHAAMSPEARAAAGIGDGLLRLSIGIEYVEDLLADIEAALTRAAQAIDSLERVKR